MTEHSGVVVLSGGQDSATMLAEAVENRDARLTAAVHFEYGQRHSVERDCAEFWAHKYHLALHVIPVPSLKHVGASALTNPNLDVNAPHRSLEHLPATFVPGRNLIFLTLAAALAARLGATDVWTGVNQQDYSGYPDCRDYTIRHLEVALRSGLDFPELRIVTPLMHMRKAAIWQLARDLGIEHDIILRTHTCYNGDRTTRHPWGYGCGECPACTIRAKGWQGTDDTSK